jgi:hypothetical protein
MDDSAFSIEETQNLVRAFLERVLRMLGLGEAVERTAAVLRRWGFFDQKGQLLRETDLQELWRDAGPYLGVTRVRLHEALLTGTAARKTNRGRAGAGTLHSARCRSPVR